MLQSSEEPELFFLDSLRNKSGKHSAPSAYATP